MAVNTQQLQTDLSVYGNVIFCDENSDMSYVIVMDGVNNGDEATIDRIINTHCLVDYPIKFNYSLINGVLKCERTK